MHEAIVTLLIFLLFVNIVITCAGVYFKYGKNHPYLEAKSDVNGISDIILDVLMTFLQNIVLFSHAIPMSIYVAIEVFKIFQVQLIHQDKKMNNPHYNANVLTAPGEE